MVDAVHKIAVFAASPLTICIALVISALIILAFKREQVAKWFLWIAVLWIYFWSIPFTGWLIGSGLEKPYPPTNVESLSNADAICILGGGVGIDTNRLVYAEMTGCADRVWHGARLFHAGKAPVIILTGQVPEKSTTPLLVDLGIPESAIVYCRGGSNTEDEARFVETAGYKKILLATSAWHMRRARFLFERKGMEVVPAACDYCASGALVSESSTNLMIAYIRLFVPDTEALSKNSSLLKEHLAYWYYKVTKSG